MRVMTGILRNLAVARPVALLAALALASNAVAQERLVEWVESNPGQSTDRIALGYPVPIPVDTPMPFDGFRSYAGLHARHQDLAATTPWVHAEAVGVTRKGRTIWAYRLGDMDTETPWGLPEPAMLTNGGIHAREWQSPETVTGILELIATAEPDRHFFDYLRDHVNMIVIPVLNIDGFLQTQRYPSLNYLDVDPSFPETSPRDGRMRRKNLRGADEELSTLNDLLRGVDLNRNNPPYWASSDRSSDDRRSLVFHGADAQSEPETRALDAAAALGPAQHLRLYTDVHSFSQVHFWGRTNNDRLARQTQEVLTVFTDHHQAFPAGKWYAFADRFGVPRNSGIGTTDEYFTVNYQVPSWTLEVEPSNGQSYHDPLPGGGADYGGAGVNGHDGFILPEAEIRRVREELAQSFAATYYRQAGPPHIQALRFVDDETGAVVYEAEWERVSETRRRLFENRIQPLVLGRKYRLWLAFSKPMRWLEDGEVTVFPGQFESFLDVDADARVGTLAVDVLLDDSGFPTEPGGAPDGYQRYVTDTLWADFSFQSSADNREIFDGVTETTLRFWTHDMTGMGLDGDPSTVATWSGGHWVGYEDSLGNDTDFGGRDETLSIPVTDEPQPDPFVLEPGIAAAWLDPERDSEGFVIEIHEGNRAVMYWFTYDDEGAQDWYIGVGEVRGNRLVFPELLSVSGATFGLDDGEEPVEEEAVGSARFIWSGCEEGIMDWRVGNRQGRQRLVRLAPVMGLDCGVPLGAPIFEEALLSGAWADPNRDGEGFTLEVLRNGGAAIWWFTFDDEGNRRWFFGPGEIVDGRIVFEDLLTSRGGLFGEAHGEGEVELPVWGRLELDLECGRGTAVYDSVEPGFGAGTMEVVQLTNLAGFSCD